MMSLGESRKTSWSCHCQQDQRINLTKWLKLIDGMKTESGWKSFLVGLNSWRNVFDERNERKITSILIISRGNIMWEDNFLLKLGKIWFSVTPRAAVKRVTKMTMTAGTDALSDDCIYLRWAFILSLLLVKIIF